MLSGNKLTLTAAAASGVEAVLKRELIDLGYTPSPAEYGRIDFFGSFSDVARANIFLRTADRVFIKLTSFPCGSFDELFAGVLAVPWEEILPADAKINVTARSIKSKLTAFGALQSVTKKAIAERMTDKLRTSLRETGTPYKAEISVVEDVAAIYLDTSGESLHKRGYRSLVGAAPIRETLAAAIIMLSVWKPERAFIDPFCGSGTLPVEAALIATNTPPGINRSFAFESFGKAPSVVDRIREEGRDGILVGKELRISGFDIDEKAVSLARYHAKRAGVEDSVHFQAMDMRQVSSRFAHGVMITNPPYGERLLTDREIRTLYGDFGKMFSSLKDWCLYVITSYVGFENYFGRRSDKNRKLYNAELECRLYQYLGKKP